MYVSGISFGGKKLLPVEVDSIKLALVARLREGKENEGMYVRRPLWSVSGPHDSSATLFLHHHYTEGKPSTRQSSQPLAGPDAEWMEALVTYINRRVQQEFECSILQQQIK